MQACARSSSLPPWKCSRYNYKMQAGLVRIEFFTGYLMSIRISMEVDLSVLKVWLHMVKMSAVKN